MQIKSVIIVSHGVPLIRVDKMYLYYKPFD